MKMHLLFIIVALCAFAIALFAWASAKLQNARPPRRRIIGNANRQFFRRHVRRLYLAPLLIQRMLHLAGFTPAPRGGIQFANIGEGQASRGVKTYIPDAVTTARYLLYKIGSTADNVALCGAGDVPLGNSDDMVVDTSVPIAINLFGVTPGTLKVVTDGTIANGNYVTTGANGQATLAVTTNVVFGRAIIGTDTTAVAGDVISITHIQPGKHPF